MKNLSRVSLRAALLFFLVPLGFASTLYAGIKRENHSWGTSSVAPLRDGLFAVSLELNSVDEKSDSAALPTKVFFFALAPGERIDPFIVSSESLPAPPMGAASVPTVQRSPSIEVRGYGWLRGYYVARLRLSPYFTDGRNLLLAQRLKIDLRGTTPSVVSVTPRSKNDPYFSSTLRDLILNYDSAVPYSHSIGADTASEWFNTNSLYLKIHIPADAIYRLTYDTLVSLLPSLTTADPRTIQVFSDGKDIPVFVFGEGDHVFSVGDYVEFPALRNYTGKQRIITTGADEYNEYLNRYTDSAVCWLTFGTTNGARIQQTATGLIPVDTLTSYTAFLHLETDNFLQYCGGDIVEQQDPRWTSGDIWGWGFINANQAVSAAFTASNIDSLGDSVRVYAKFASWGADNVSPAHNIAIRLNGGSDLNSVLLNRYQQALLTGSAPVSNLVNGSNTVSLFSKPTASTTINSVIYDWFEVEYPRVLTAVNDSLIFDFRRLSDRKIRAVKISGLNTKDVLLYKVSRNSEKVTDTTFSGNGPYTLIFVDSVGPAERYILLPESRVHVPVIKYVKQFAGLRQQTQQTDYLIITHSKFKAEAEQYRQYVASAGKLTTRLVDVQDIFDEFGFGYPAAEAIQAFLRTTGMWSPPQPSFLFLIGDASYDYKFVMKQQSAINYVPSFGQPVSDEELVSWDTTTYVPQMMVGRLPADNVGDVTQYLQRVQSYDAAPDNDWNKRYLFFTGGDPTVPGQVESYKAVNDNILNSYVTSPLIGGQAIHFYKTVSPQSDFGPYTIDHIHSAIAQGAVFISYIGHSGTQTWDNGIGDPAQLQNTRGRFSLVTDFGCSTGRFAEPDIKSFSELFLLGHSASAIDYIGNSSLGFNSIATTLPTEFYAKILRDSIRTVGEAHLDAKLSIISQYGLSPVNKIMLETNSLIGDPAIDLAVPFTPNPAVTPDLITSLVQAPTDDLDSTAVRVVIANYGSVASDSIDIFIQQKYNGNVVKCYALRCPMPLLYDTLLFYADIKNRAGGHQISVDIDPNNRLNEISKSDNSAEMSFVVNSNDFKILEPLPNGAYMPAKIVLLNPPTLSADSSLEVTLQLDTTEAFTNPKTYSATAGSVTTTFTVSSLKNSTRYRWRAKSTSSSSEWTTGAFYAGNYSAGTIGQVDSLGWSEDNFVKTEFTASGKGGLQRSPIAIEAISSGFIDGKFGAVEVNGLNVIPNTFLRGHTVVVFDTLTFNVVEQRNFDLYGDASQADSLINYLHAIPNGFIVAAMIVDEGANNFTTAARNAYTTVGSALIYKVQYRDSWAIIGRKGAAPGTVPEMYVPSGGGKAIVDTTFIKNETCGSITTPEIGPASRWQTLTINRTIPSGALLRTNVVGIRQSGSVDTLLGNVADASVNLSAIAAKTYPELTFVFNVSANSGLQSPSISQWAMTSYGPAELAVNARSVALSKTLVSDGTPITVNAKIFNVGTAEADSVPVILSTDDSGNDRVLQPFMIPVIKAGDSATVQYEYDSRGKRGAHSFIVQVDPDRTIPELYKSNNAIAVPFTVIADTIAPMIDVTFDGTHIQNGDYVKAVPTILFKFSDNALSTFSSLDTNSIRILLNDGPVYYNSPDIDVLPQQSVVQWKPHLAEGENVIAYNAKDASGNFTDTTTLVVNASSKMGLINVFNIPNPFSHETHFTFTLSGTDRPENAHIKIYTVAGRAVQDLDISSDVDVGFNSVEWDGRDRDGDELANGVYLYRVVVSRNGQQAAATQKLVMMR
ncbi:MAG: hypothetical protein KGJ59_07435 [Bacteroidota bacterium]|nr:hypothetical protein [Bacteroidota bacterium]